MVFMDASAYPAAVRVFRIVLIWTALMSGIFSLCREFYFAYLGASGQTVSPTNVLVVFGHLSMAAFIVSGASTWYLENRQVKALQEQQKKPIFVARRNILDLQKRGKSMMARLERGSWRLPSEKQIRKLRLRLEHILESYASPMLRSSLLTISVDEYDRANRMLRLTDKQMERWDSLSVLLRAMNGAISNIDDMRTT